MKPFFVLLLFSFLSYSGVAQTRVVSYDKSSSIDFSKYKTFNFHNTDIEEGLNKIGKVKGLDILKAAIERELKARNITLDESNPDLLINIGVTTEDVVQTRETDIRDAPAYMGTRNYHWESGEVVVREYKEGTVTLDFVDAQNNEMVWQGAAAGTMTKNVKKRDKRINSAMAKLFKKFPI